LWVGLVSTAGATAADEPEVREESASLPSALNTAIEALAEWSGETSFEATAHVVLGRVTFGPGSNAPTEGSYRLLRTDRDTWREEIRLPGYSRVVLARDGARWIDQEGEYQWLRVLDLEQLLNFESRHRETTAGTLQADKRRSGKHPLRCFQFEVDSSTEELCIDPDDGMLRKESSVTKNSRVKMTIAYSDYAPSCLGPFPRRLVMEWNGRLAVDLTIEELRALDRMPAIFDEAASPNQKRLPMDCRLSEPIPERDRGIAVGLNSPASGHIAARLLVDQSGVVREFDVLRSGDGMIDAMRDYLAAVQWTPGTCDDIPIDSVYLFQYSVSVNRGPFW